MGIVFMVKQILHKIGVLLACLVMVCNTGYGQDFPATQEPDIKVIKGRRFYIHTVQREETLYGISKRYNVEIKDIVLENPLAINGLSAGQTLKLPVPMQILDTKALDGKFIYHTVQPGETYYSISRQYETTVEVLRAANPEMVEGIKAGVSMRIPVMESMQLVATELGVNEPDSHVVDADTLFPDDSVYVETDTVLFHHVIKDSMVFKDTYNIAIMLPFYLDFNDSIEEKRKPEDPVKIFSRSKVALAYYQGALIALDSMRKQGMSIHAFIYDTNNDTAQVKKILAQKELEDMDMIIGPLYRSNLTLVSVFAKDRGIEVVSPLITTNRILRGNSHLSKAKPCIQTHVDGLASYIRNTFYADSVLSLNEMKLVVIHNEDPGEKLLAEQFMEHIKKTGETSDSTQTDSGIEVKLVSYRERGMEAVEEALSIADTNILVVPSRDQSFVSNLASGLFDRQEEYNVIVFGLPVWKNFYNIDGNKLHQQKVHISSPSYIDHGSPAVVSFVKEFHKRYYDYPSQYAFQGFDLTYFMMNMLKSYGYNYQSYLPEANIPTLQTNYSFQPIPGGGYENQKVYILKYEDYELKLAAEL